MGSKNPLFCIAIQHTQISMPFRLTKNGVEHCLKNNIPGLAVSDHGTAVSMYYATRIGDLVAKINKNNKTAYTVDQMVGIPAVELYVKLHAEDKSHHHIVVWAVTQEGYFNLMKLASLAYEDQISIFGAPKPRVTFAQILEHKAGLKFGTACIASPIGKAVMKNDLVAAEELYKQYIEMFGSDLYVEFHPTDLTHNFDRKTGGFLPIPPSPVAPDGNMQKAYNLFLMHMVSKYGGKPIPASDAHFIDPQDKVIQDIILKAGNENGWHFKGVYCHLNADQLYEGLKAHLGDWLTVERFNEWIANTHEVVEAARGLKVKFEYHLPKIDIPTHISDKTDDYNKQTYLLLMEKIKQHGRWRDTPEYIERFKKELDVIYKNATLNFLPYFLLYEDVSAYARSVGIVQNIARGSAGGALISYYLKIIHIDPIANHLPFERFLSHARIRAGSFPDIDLDLSSRDKVLEYLSSKYKLGFAQIATFHKMKVKSAIKDAMWGIYNRNRNDPEVKAVCDTIPDSPQGIDELGFLYGYTDQEDVYHSGQMETNEVLQRFFRQYPDIQKAVNKLIGVVRGVGRHASAFVISTVDLASSRCPTMILKSKDAGDVLITQYEAPMVEKSGLVKADILSVTTLETVSQCLELIKTRTGRDLREVDKFGVEAVYRLPEDSMVYGDFYKKDTDSSFQFNTSLIKGMVQDFNPKCREDLSVFTALARPGAMDAPLFNTTATKYYIEVRKGDRRLELLHPDMEKYTQNSVMAFQENVMAFLVDIAGYSLEEADQIRGAIAKKKHEVILASFDRIRAGCTKRGWDDEAIETVCQQIQAFSRYSFNRSHSRAYSELGYITMYLKHHYPLEWWTAVLNTVDDEDKRRHFMSILQDKLMPPSINNAFSTFTILGESVATPISAVKGVGDAARMELSRCAPFTSLDDFIARVAHGKVNAGHVAALIKARAMDPFFDPSIPYIEARDNLILQYSKSRKLKSNALLDMPSNVLEIFLAEKDTNTCFNKRLLDDDQIIKHIMNYWPGLKRLPHRDIPLRIGETFIVSSTEIAKKFIEKGSDISYGMILLYGGSSYKTGISKRSGREWHKLDVTLSDGYSDVECVWWDRKAPLKWPKNSLVYVKGKLKEGYRNPVSIIIEDIQLVEQIGDRKDD